MTQSLFFYGTLCHLPLLETVLGHDLAPLDIRTAQLQDHAVYWADQQSFPVLVAQSGGTAHGVSVAGLTDDDVARLNFYEGGFSYELRPVTVQSAQGAVDTRVYFATPGAWPQGAAWRLADWEAQWARMILRAAEESMTYYGRLSHEDFARIYPMVCGRAAAWVAAQAPKPATLRSAQPASGVEIVSSETVHVGFHMLQVQHLRHALFDGGKSEVLRREVFVSGDAAIVLPYDPKLDRVLMVEQFRMGPLGRGDPRPWQLEPVAGRVDPGETPENAARREALEEAGLTLHDLEHIASYYPTPGSVTDYFHSYIGLCDLPDAQTDIGGLDAEHEDIKTHVLSFEAAMDLLTTGEVDVGPLVLALMWLQRERPRLRAAA